MFDKNLYSNNFDYVIINTSPRPSSLLFNALNVNIKL